MDSVIIEICSTGYTIKATVVDSPSKPENFLMDLEEILMIKWNSPYQLSTPYEGTWKVRLNFYHESEFLTRSVTAVLPNRECDKFSDYTFGQDYYVGESKKALFPTIHVFSSNVFSLNLPLFPRYSAIMDSSIWNFYYSKEEALLEKSRRKSKTNVLLFDFFEHILRYYSERRYDLCIAREFAEFNARMVCNSYFADSGGHGNFVSPFIFHRELNSYYGIQTDNTDFVGKANCLMRCSHDEINADNMGRVMMDFKWRLLLVDDFSKEPLKTYDNHSGNGIPNKCDIICSDIVKVFPEVKIGFTDDCVSYSDASKKSIDAPSMAMNEKDFDIVIHCVTKLDDAKKALKDRKYEVILLDYLLGPSEDQGEPGCHREYGYQLLDSIKKEEDEKESEKKYKGPLGEQYIMFITAFTTAINEKLLAEHWTRNEKDLWHIGQGACPTNTTTLFLFYLLRMMKRRVDSVESYIDFWKIIRSIFSDEGNVRKMARKSFTEICELKIIADKVRTAAEQGSRFFQSINNLSFASDLCGQL